MSNHGRIVNDIRENSNFQSRGSVENINIQILNVSITSDQPRDENLEENYIQIVDILILRQNLWHGLTFANDTGQNEGFAEEKLVQI